MHTGEGAMTAFVPYPLLALVYTDSARADAAMRDLALALLERSVRLAGLVQVNRPRPGRSRCDMVLEELATGESVAISQDRGPHARGCALDLGQLVSATERLRRQLVPRPDLVILNKFGKAEAEGGGFRDLIGDVVAAAIPLIIAVPWRNIESWRVFSGDLGREVVLEEEGDSGAIPLLTRIAAQWRGAPWAPAPTGPIS